MDTLNTFENSIQVITSSIARRDTAIPLEEVAILLHPSDDVAIARTPLSRETKLLLPDGIVIEMTQRVQPGHKVALHDIEEKQPVRKYGSVIGFTTRPIKAGSHVHTHNLAVGKLDLNYEFGAEYRPLEYMPVEQRQTFLGYRRPDGRAATRNYIALISTVNCSASTIRQVQARFGTQILRQYPNVDGIIGLTHKSGCAMQQGGEAIEQLQRTLAGMAAHPNVGAYILLGLGCESNQVREMIANRKLGMGASGQWKQPIFLNIQEHHGIADTVEDTAQILGQLLAQVNDVQREPIPVSELIVALQCGGSDGWSGITANPSLGYCVDELVRQGGTAVLSETPEIYGAEDILLRRARSQEVGERLVERIRWWEHYTAINGMEMDNNPSPGNKLGGLTTIYEKSLGAIAKGGSTALNAVYKYAEQITERGLVIMDTPGYDPVSVTGQVVGGANVVVFTTGRGSVFGFKPAPSIKVATNTTLYNNMTGDMDINAGIVLDGVSVQEVGRQILEEVIAVASGKQSKSEAQGVGEEEFAPWVIGATM
jgi:altronate hydrolase